MVGGWLVVWLGGGGRWQWIMLLCQMRQPTVRQTSCPLVGSPVVVAVPPTDYIFMYVCRGIEYKQKVRNKCPSHRTMYYALTNPLNILKYCDCVESSKSFVWLAFWLKQINNKINVDNCCGSATKRSDSTSLLTAVNNRGLQRSRPDHWKLSFLIILVSFASPDHHYMYKVDWILREHTQVWASSWLNVP